MVFFRDFGVAFGVAPKTSSSHLVKTTETLFVLASSTSRAVESFAAVFGRAKALPFGDLASGLSGVGTFGSWGRSCDATAFFLLAAGLRVAAFDFGAWLVEAVGKGSLGFSDATKVSSA